MKFMKVFVMLVTVCSIVLLFIYLPIFLGVGNTVKVVNLNVYSERLRETFGQSHIVDELTGIKSGDKKKGAVFRGHNNGSSIKSIEEVKDMTKPKDFDEEPVKKKEEKVTASKAPESVKAGGDSNGDDKLPKCSDRGTNLGETVPICRFCSIIWDSNIFLVLCFLSA
jgi:hypothetical protein